MEPARLRVLLLVPAAGAQVGDVVGNAPVERQDQPDRELGDGDGVLAGAVRDVDSERGRGGDVDGVDAGAGAHDERELAGLEHRRGDLGRTDDQHARARVAQGLGQRFFLEIGAEIDVTAGGREAVEAARFELVGYQDFHRCSLAGWGLGIELPGPDGAGSALRVYGRDAPARPAPG